MEKKKINVKGVINKDVDMSNIRQVSEVYKTLNLLEKEAKTEQGKLKPTLIENKVNEFFEDDQMKVQFTEGSIMTSINTSKVVEEIGTEAFLEIAKVTESDLKAYLEKFSEKEESARILAKCKDIIGTKSDSVKVANMTKKELKERGLA